MDGRNEKLKKLVLSGLMMALIVLTTSVFKIYTIKGYIHLGDGFVFLSAILLGPFYGAFASGVGSMLADYLAGFAEWAPYTLVIKSAMAMVMGLVIRSKTKRKTYFAAGVTLLVWLAFFVTIKNALLNAIQFSPDILAATLGITTEELVLRAEEIQWQLTAAILIFLVIIFVLLLWYVKKHHAEGFGPGMVFGMMSAGACMIIGYYFAEILLFQNPIAPVFGVSMNLIQFILGIVITSAVAPVLAKLKLIDG